MSYEPPPLSNLPKLPPIIRPTGSVPTKSADGVNEEDKKSGDIKLSDAPKVKGTVESMGESTEVATGSERTTKSTNKTKLDGSKKSKSWEVPDWLKRFGNWCKNKCQMVGQAIRNLFGISQKHLSEEQAQKATEHLEGIAMEVQQANKDPNNVNPENLANDISGLEGCIAQISDPKAQKEARQELKTVRNVAEIAVLNAHQQETEDLAYNLSKEGFQKSIAQGMNPLHALLELIKISEETCGLAGEIARKALKNINGVEMSEESIEFLKACYTVNTNKLSQIPGKWDDFQSGLEALKQDSPEIADYFCQQLFETNYDDNGVTVNRLVEYCSEPFNTAGNLDTDGFPNIATLVEFGRRLAYLDSMSHNVTGHESDFKKTLGRAKDLGDKVFQKLLEKKDSKAEDTETQKLFGQSGKVMGKKRAQFLGPKFEAIGQKLEQIETLGPDQKNSIMNLLCKNITKGLTGSDSNSIPINSVLYNDDSGKANFDIPDWFSYKDFVSNPDEEVSNADGKTSVVDINGVDVTRTAGNPANQKIDILQKKYGLCGQIAQKFIETQEEPSDTLELTRASMDFLGACYVNGPSQLPKVPDNWEAFQSGLETLKKDNPGFANYVCQQLFAPNSKNENARPFVDYFANNLSSKENLGDDGFPNTKAIVEFGKQLVFLESVSPLVISNSLTGNRTDYIGPLTFQKLKNSGIFKTSQDSEGNLKPISGFFTLIRAKTDNFSQLKEKQFNDQVKFLTEKLGAIGKELDQNTSLDDTQKDKIMNRLFTDIMSGLVHGTSATNKVIQKIVSSGNLPKWFTFFGD